MATQRSPGCGPALLRPLLRLPRTTLRAAAASRGLDWLDDESNADCRLRRNWLRSEIAPRLASMFPGYPDTLLRAAAHQADAARLADDLAALDAQGALTFDAVDGAMLDQARLVSIAALGEHRARNLLRWFLARHDLPAPSSSRLEAMLRQLTRSSADARVRLAHAGVELGLHRQRIVVHAPALPWSARRWRGEPELELPQGRLRFTPACGAGLAADHARAEGLAIRCREGGERLRPGPGRPRRRVTHLFQEHGVPAWRRDVWPLIYVGEALAAVPGIGIDPAFGASGDGAGFAVAWLPSARQSLIPVNPGAQVPG